MLALQARWRAHVSFFISFYMQLKAGLLTPARQLTSSTFDGPAKLTGGGARLQLLAHLAPALLLVGANVAAIVLGCLRLDANVSAAQVGSFSTECLLLWCSLQRSRPRMVLCLRCSANVHP